MYEKRVVSVVVNKAGQPLYSETATTIEIVDEGGGEFIRISQEGGHTDFLKFLTVDPDEWPTLRQSISEMIDGCRKEST